MPVQACKRGWSLWRCRRPETTLISIRPSSKDDEPHVALDRDLQLQMSRFSAAMAGISSKRRMRISGSAAGAAAQGLVRRRQIGGIGDAHQHHFGRRDRAGGGCTSACP
jgi:hypothetical protein